MERRDALKRLALAGAGAAAGPAWVTALCEIAHAHASGMRSQAGAAWTPKVFTPHENTTVVTLTELIIPETDTAAAKVAEVNVFIDPRRRGSDVVLAILAGAPGGDLSVVLVAKRIGIV